MTRTLTLPLAIALTLGLCACNNREATPPTAAADARPVFASNYPLAYFAEQLLDDPDKVYFPAIDGDPAFWQPTREQIAQIQGARVILLNGATYEKWAAGGVTLPDDRVTRTTAAFADQLIETQSVKHSHGPDGDHSHGGTAFTTWLDLKLAVQQLGQVRDALARAELAPKAELDRRHDALAKELAAIDEQLAAVTKGRGDVPLVASHPVYQYFARRYGLDLHAVHWEPDALPDDKGWAELDEALEGHAAKTMLWEGQPLQATVAKLKERGIASVVVDPCGNRPESGDLLTVMRANVEALKGVFKP